jgi:hypothetical protein
VSGPDKYKILKAVADRANQKQPDEIHLLAALNPQWSNPVAIEGYVAGLRSLGFVDAGIYSVDVLPVVLQFFLKEGDRMYAVVYEHPKAGIWINLVALFEDGTSITFTSTQDRGLETRPGHPTIHVPGATAQQLYSAALAHCPAGARKLLTPESIIKQFEKAWIDGIQWRKSRGGISATEVASVILSRGGQPTRVLRPERVQYIGEQDGGPERELKTAVSKVFDSYPGVTKAYLVRVKYDESAEVNVALCLQSSVREMKLVDEIRSAFKALFRLGEHLDIMFVTPAEAQRIEGVCFSFFSRG